MKLTSVITMMKIVSFIKNHGGNFKDWYVGITMDPKTRMQFGHNVNFHNDKFIILATSSCDEARLIEKYIIDNYATDGGPGGGGAGADETEYVYAYLKTKMTKEAALRRTFLKILAETIEDEKIRKIIEEM